MEGDAKPLPETPGVAGQSPFKDDRPKSGQHGGKRMSAKSRVDDDADDEEFEFFHIFEREKIKGVIHLITSELKERGADVEYIMIPFRPEQKNEKLLKFLNQLFPMGNGQPVKKAHQQKIISKTEVWTLFQGIKYIWCRLPNSEIIGWKSYLEFKYREADKKYPQKAFLEIMPQCLESSNHASIVYDFFDLIVTLASNSKVNKMSARKVCKMCAVWAFNKPSQSVATDGPSYDFDSNGILPRYKKVNNSFQDGLDEWIPASDAMFHLLLSFLKSFVPKDLESAKLPRSLKSILFNNEYPPKDSTAFASETILTIPLVTLYTDKFSRKPWQLLERCNEMLDFSDYDAFEAREDYALLKSLFKKKNNVEGISRKMSQESRRLMKAMSTKHSTFQAGWAPRKCLDNINHLEENIQIRRVDIDDYFIWTWLSTLSYEETSQKKMLFGRSVILEFEFDGFKKWVCFQECDITLDYNSQSQLKDKTIEKEARSRSNSPTKSRKEKSPVKTRREPTEIPKIRNEPQTYEKFQVSNDKSSRMPSAQQQLPQQQPGQYHTTISLDVLNKNGKQPKSSFEKISKWNPLHNLRKKSNGSSGSSLSSSHYDERIPSNSERNSSNSSNRGSDLRNVSDYGTKPSKKYELPPIEADAGDFSIDLPDISPDMIDAPTPESRSQLSSRQHSQPPQSQPQSTRTSNSTGAHRDTLQSNSETIEEINEMVENMISDELSEEQPIEVGLSDTFRNVTKFDQYKPSAMRENELDNSLSSTVQSLKINSPQDPMPPRDIANAALRNNGSNLSIEQVQNQRHSPVRASPPKNYTQDMPYPRGNSREQVGGPTYNSPPKEQGGRWPNPGQADPYSQGVPPMDNMRNGPKQPHQDRPVRDQQQPYPQAPRQGKPPQGPQMTGPQNGQYHDLNKAPRSGPSHDSQAPPPAMGMPKERGRMKQQQHGAPPMHGQPQQPHQQYGAPPMNIQPQQIPPNSGRGSNKPNNGMYPPPGPPQPGYNYSNSPQRTQSPMRQPRSSSPMRNPQGPPGPGQYAGAPSPGFYNQNMPMQQGRSSSPMRQGGSPMVTSQSQYPMQRPPQQQGQYNMMPSPSMQFNQPQMSPQQRTHGFNQQPPMPMGPNYGSPQFAQGPMMQGQGQGYGGYGTAPPNTIPMQTQHGGAATKLHGNVNKRQDRRQLYDNIRSGNFGI